MSDEILDEILALEKQVNALTKTFIACTTDLLEAVKVNTEMVAQLSEAVALARSPSKEDLERSKTLREAFDRYEFVRKLALTKEEE